MDEYQDQVTWFELWGDNGEGAEFIADFDTREQAETYQATSPVAAAYDRSRIERVRGQA